MNISDDLRRRIVIALTSEAATQELLEAIERGVVEPTADGVSPDVQAALNTKLNKSGGTMTGVLDMNSNAISNLPAASLSHQPATKAQLDSTASTLNASIASVGSALSALQSKVDVVPATSVYVASNGSDTTGNGSSTNPFATVQKAVDSLPASGHAAVYIMPGVYTGTTTITRTRTHLIGLGSTNSNVNSVQIGPVVFNVSGGTGGVNADNSSICNILINGASGQNCLEYLGSAAMSLYFVNSYCFTGYANQSAIYMNNTSPSNSRLYLFSSILNASASTGTSITLNVAAGLVWQLIDSQIYCDSNNTAARAIKLAGSSRIVTGSRLNISGKGQYVIELAGGSNVANISGSYIEQITANASGVSLAAGAQLYCIQNVFNVPSGTGFCVNGSAGAVLAHAQNVFFANTKFPSAMGPGVVALTTAPTLA